jgi:hypothetical protein
VLDFQTQNIKNVLLPVVNMTNKNLYDEKSFLEQKESIKIKAK